MNVACNQRRMLQCLCGRRWRSPVLLTVMVILGLSSVQLSLRWTDARSEEDVKYFLRKYDQKCMRETRNQQRGSMCPCVPIGLGPAVIDLEASDADPRIQRAFSGVEGGGWEPRHCHPHHRVAIIIPYRNREEHLRILLHHLHPFLQQQLIAYHIFVIEQVSPKIFNRASLMNVGYKEAETRAPFTCYIFHDVDLLPEDTRNMYTCTLAPVHLGAYMNKHGYKLLYPTFFGGAVALTGQQILTMNGFSNEYYGWGGEDDDAYSRVLESNLTIYRYPQKIGRSYMIKHDADKGNPPSAKRDIAYNSSLHSYQEEGLNTVRYKLIDASDTDLYTHVKVDIEKEFKPECVVDPSLPLTLAGNYVDCMDDEENFKTGLLDCCGEDGVVVCCRTFPLPWTGSNLRTLVRKKIVFIPLGLLLLVSSGLIRKKYYGQKRGSKLAKHKSFKT